MLKRWGIASAVALGLLGWSSNDARADWDLQLATSMGGGWLREAPDMDADKISLASRDIGKGSLKNRGGLGMMGLGGDVELTLTDKWKFPLAGVAMWWTMGTYDGVTTSYDGSIAHIHPWSTFRGDVLLPGIGRRIKLRRNMISFALRTGVTWMKMDGDVATGGSKAPLDLSAVSFLVQAEVEACRRFDPTTRLCVQVAPRVYEYTLMNGLTVNLRLEWGR